MITVCTGKLHCIHVTEARLEYEGSITLGRDLMRAAGIVPFQLVHINSMATAVHWETYAIPGNDGQVCLNGCPARLFHPGDRVIVLALQHIELEGTPKIEQRVVHVDRDNRVTRVEIKNAANFFTV